jgi:hypothetical protein
MSRSSYELIYIISEFGPGPNHKTKRWVRKLRMSLADFSVHFSEEVRPARVAVYLI